MRFTCSRFPDGDVPIRTTKGVVVFTDGVAEVDDPELAQALMEVPGQFGISGEGPKRAAKKAARPKPKE